MAENTDIFDGTVSVTAGTKIVTGVGTLWMSAGIQPGDMFGSDGHPRARIDTVNSNTSITLKDNWRGPTLPAGSAYWIRYQADSSRYSALLGQVRKMLSQASVAALSALTGAANKLPYFTDANIMDLADFRAKGRDIVAAATASEAYTALGVVPNEQLPARLRSTVSADFSTDANGIVETGFYQVGSGAANVPLAVTGIIQCMRQATGYINQFWYQRDGNRIYARNQINGVWGAWVEITSDPAGVGRSTAGLGVNDIGSYIFARNTQVSAIGSGATVFGANLRFARITPANVVAENTSTQSGSWMNCSATKPDTDANATGLYKRIL